VLEEEVRSRSLARADVQAALPKIEAEVTAGTLPPTEGARRLLALREKT
jgi:hypothetical protein